MLTGLKVYILRRTMPPYKTAFRPSTSKLGVISLMPKSPATGNIALSLITAVIWLFHLSLPVLEGQALYFELPMWYRSAMHVPSIFMAIFPGALGMIYGSLLRGEFASRTLILALFPLAIFFPYVLANSWAMSEAAIGDGGAMWVVMLTAGQMLAFWLGGAVSFTVLYLLTRARHVFRSRTQ